MASIDYNIFEVEPQGLSGFRSLTNEDLQLVSSAEISKTFKPNDNFIELSFYTLDNTRLQTIPNYSNYSILSGDTESGDQGNSEIGIDVKQDYISYGFQGQEVKALYNFLDYPYSNSTNPQDFYIESISPDRTEVRLVSVNLGGADVLETTNKLKDLFVNDTYAPELYIYFGNNIYFSIVNIDTEEFRETNAVLIKLYKPLPSAVNPKVRLNIVEKVSDSIAFEINTVITPEKEEIPTLRGANFNVEIDQQATEPSQYYNYTELFSFPTNNSYRELNNLFNEKGAELGVDYSELSNFINFSSAEERLRNFKYKLDLINSYQSSLDNINITGVVYTNVGISGSRAYYENLLNGVVNNFDHYERHLYFESGSTSWPKSNTSKPYINLESSDTEANNWYIAELEDAILYDAQNPDILTNTIPAYLKEDTDNRPYELFVHMIAQHFDNLWLYTDAVSKKYDADNRLTRGVSKDLVEELLKNFGIKLYTSNKSVEDLFRYFTINSYNAPEEYLPSGITTSGQAQVSQNDYQKEIYKRIYHNLPLLLKSKGTERGVRALINCFGIPSDVLKIKIYGGQSANDLPFYGGEQAWTGSLDKVRLDNTGSIVEGDTLSFYTSIVNGEDKYTQDLHRIEIGFSPADNINSYIVSQSAVLFPNDPFNIDNYIGDPREVTTNVYSALRDYADQIFEDVGYYNLKDFVRLIKFFDNVIFRMVRDFVPGRSVTDSGIIIKPHLLERSKYTSPVMTWTRPEYSGSIDTAFISGSNAGAYKNIGIGSVGTNKFKKESSTKRLHTVPTPIGNRNRFDKLHEEPKFNGELFNSYIKATDGEMNSSNPFKNLEYPNVRYNIQFYVDPPSNLCLLELGALPRVVLDPLTANNSYNNYNLSNLFSNSSPVYDYTITNQGGITETLQGLDVNFDFLSNGNYVQYEVFNITVFHQDDNTDFNGTCNNTREVQIVACDLIANANIFQTFTVDQFYDLTTLWNASSSDNTDISYIINGTTYSESDVTNIEFSHTEYPNGEDINIIIQENNNPNNCYLEFNIPYNSCVLQATNESAISSDGESFDEPYGINGTNSNTTFQFRLEWNDRSYNPFTGLFSGVLGATSTASTHVGYWVNIEENLPVPTSVTDILADYPDASAVDPNLSEPSIGFGELDFNLINQGIVNESEQYISRGPIKIRFKAINDETCSVQQLVLNEIENPLLEPVWYCFDAQRNNTLNTACCSGEITQVCAKDRTSLEEVFANTQAGYNGYAPDRTLHQQPDQSSPGAPSGWYTTGEVSWYWINSGNSAFPGMWTGTPNGRVICDEVNIDNC